jgi:hypothetical protein
MRSESLDMEVAWSEKTGALYCEDGVVYSPAELAVLKEAGIEITKEVHNVKNVFKGSEIVNWVKYLQTHKPAEGLSLEAARNTARAVDERKEPATDQPEIW